MTLMETLALLIAGHYLADFALQTDFVAQAKNRNTTIGKVFWPHVLAAHSTIHGLLVGVVTGSLLLAVLEAVLHAIIDFVKCEGCIDIHTDQALHLSCKLVYVAIMTLL